IVIMHWPKRLFNVVDMKVEMYTDIQDIKEHGYIAVSHVWGDQKMHAADTLGITAGVDWQVPLSDPKKMDRLKNAMIGFEYKYCWFDVLCMPQDEERKHEINEEIPLMGSYYGGAQMTLALSDEEYVMSEEFVKWYIMLGDAMKSGREFTIYETVWLTAVKVALLDFSREKWFTRVWTLQEVALSKATILVGANGCNIHLSNVIRRLLYASSKNPMYDIVFRSHAGALNQIGDVVKQHREGTLDLARVMLINASRFCSREQDRYYGVLGILGYTDLEVKYDLDMDSLNKVVVQYACSKGDISWMAVGEHLSAGFIQPLHNKFQYIGWKWIEDRPGVCNIAFYENTVRINAKVFGNVIRIERFGESGKDLNDRIVWIIHKLRSWGFDNTMILMAMTGYVGIRLDRVRTGLEVVDALVRHGSLENLHASISMDENKVKHVHDIIATISQNTRICQASTVLVQMHVLMDNQMYPVIVSGEADVGDVIVMPRVHDFGNRTLGIVVSETSIRRGTCLMPEKNLSEERENLDFTPHWFVL
ncbi:hypothetical protein BGZ99_002736, partial [Dissophora globulifera]